MRLSELLMDIEYTLVQGDLETKIHNVVYDSRQMQENDVFVCIKGTGVDGHKFIPQVIEKGAAAIVVTEDVTVDAPITVIKVTEDRKTLAYMSAAYFGYPAMKLKTIGITGTKGKTTTAYMIRQVLESVGIKTGLIGTIGTIIGDEKIPSNNTTPESYLVQQSFAKMVEEGCECVVMEVSSQGLKQSRVAGITFDYGIFTNIEPDHIGPNEHADFEEYAQCKGMLLKQCKCGIVNADADFLDTILQGHTCELETYGIDHECDIQANDIQLFTNPGCLGISYQLSGKLNFSVKTHIPGKFSVYNSLCAIAICSHFTNDIQKIQSALENVSVKGRVEMIPISKRFTLMIDYAHNAMSLESLLTSLREYHPKRIVTMFGCGGNRSADRRFEMGEVSSKLSDLTVITSDNPRFEEPMDIIEDIVTGVGRADGEYVVVPDRKDAIRYVIMNAKDGDVIVLAGKGHEDYQEIKGKKYPMDERVLIQEIVKEEEVCKVL